MTLPSLFHIIITGNPALNKGARLLECITGKPQGPVRQWSSVTQCFVLGEWKNTKAGTRTIKGEEKETKKMEWLYYHSVSSHSPSR